MEEIQANLLVRLQEAKEQGRLGEVAAIEASLAAAEQKLAAMHDLAARHPTVHLGMPDFRGVVARIDAEQRLGRYSFQLPALPGGLRPLRDPDAAEGT